jgi:hypothetical protein
MSGLEKYIDRLADPDDRLLPGEIGALLDFLGWPRERARTVPGGLEIEGWKSPRGSLWQHPPAVNSSLDAAAGLLPWGWDWLKRSRADGVIEFVILDPLKQERSTCEVRAGRHGLPNSDAACLAAAALRAWPYGGLLKEVRNG